MYPNKDFEMGVVSELGATTPRRRKRMSISIQPFSNLARTLRASVAVDPPPVSPRSVPVMLSFAQTPLTPPIVEDKEASWCPPETVVKTPLTRTADCWNSTGSLKGLDPISHLDFSASSASTYATLRKPPSRRLTRSADIVRKSWEFEDREREARRNSTANPALYAFRTRNENFLLKDEVQRKLKLDEGLYFCQHFLKVF